LHSSLLLKNKIVDKKNGLNGIDGFARIEDKYFDEFTDYSQQYIEQSDRTITIGLTAVLLIVIIILLL